MHLSQPVLNTSLGTPCGSVNLPSSGSAGNVVSNRPIIIGYVSRVEENTGPSGVASDVVFSDTGSWGARIASGLRESLSTLYSGTLKQNSFNAVEVLNRGNQPWRIAQIEALSGSRITLADVGLTNPNSRAAQALMRYSGYLDAFDKYHVGKALPIIGRWNHYA